MKTILIIEDHEIMQGRYKMVLQAQHHRVLSAINAAEALGILLRDHVDVIFSSMRMSHEDAYTLLRSVKGSPATAAIPYILVTGSSIAQVTEETGEIFSNFYLSRPIKAKDLVNTIAQFLGAAHAPEVA